MIYEVAAAVEHILSLITEVERTVPVSSEALAGFASTLKDALETRCQRCWHAADPELGSAQRSIAWQLHPAGEGADLDLLRAFASVLAAKAEEREIVHPHHPNVLALALEWLPTAFTLWIDPGCVAIRRGAGPGATSATLDFDHLSHAFSSSAINVIWGHMVAQPADRLAPQLTVSSAPRPIPILKPTALPAAGSRQRYPVHAISNARPVLASHHRALSSSSSVSSISERLVRSTSLSSAHTVSTDATSLNGHESDACSEACPSLCSPASSLASSQYTPASHHDRESAHDTTLGDTTERFAGVRLFGDAEADAADDDAGDTTIQAGALLGLSIAKPHASTPVKANYTTHDNGNVGVLGGGVRLGGSSAKPTQPAAPAPRLRQHSNSKSISNLQGVHNQLLPPYLARALPPAANAPHYSAPMRTVPLPPMPLAGHYAPPMPHAYPHAAYAPVPPRAAWSGPTQLPTPYGFRAPAPVQPFAPHAAGAHGEALEGDDDDEAHTGRRRMRSRGRRSRGRGAGRAARRQAAALRALELGSTDELAEYADGSRCSTPATTSASEDTDVDSVYSSAASSPHKRGELRSEHSNLATACAKSPQHHDVFGIHLASGLARLQHVHA